MAPSHITVLMHVPDWYVTLSVIAGVDPSDPVTNPSPAGTGTYGVDGVDMWPAILGQNKTNPRPWLPTTKYSILLQRSDGSILKLITEARQTNLFTADGLQQTRTADPRVPPLNKQQNSTDCFVCGPNNPCLYDVVAGPSESTNLANRNEYSAVLHARATRFLHSICGRQPGG